MTHSVLTFVYVGCK